MLDLGIERSNPDYFAVTVMNEIFGGGFSSRLFNNLRTAQGPGLLRGRRRRLRLGPSRPDQHRDADQERQHGGGHQGIDSEIDDLLKKPPNARGTEARQGQHPELVHLRVRHSGKSAARKNGLRVLSLPARLPRALSQRGREGHRRRCGRASPRSICTKIRWRCWWSATSRVRQAAELAGPGAEDWISRFLLRRPA